MKKQPFLSKILLLVLFAFLIATCSSKSNPTSPDDTIADTLSSTIEDSTTQSQSESTSSDSSTIIDSPDDSSSSSQSQSSVSSSESLSSSSSVSSQPQTFISVEITLDTNRIITGNSINFSYSIESTDDIDEVKVDFYGNGIVDTILSNENSGTFSKVFDAVGSFYTIIVAENNREAVARDSVRINIMPLIPDSGTVDDTPPVITLNPPIYDTIDLYDTWFEPGFEATDNLGNNITSFVERVIYDTLRVSRVESYLTINAGVYTVEYNVEDYSGNAAEIQIRTIVVEFVDVTPPVIDLVGSTNMSIQRGQPYVEPGFNAYDDHDDNSEVTSNVQVSVRNSSNDLVDINSFTSNTGVYTISYDVSDEAGNQAETAIRTVTVISDVENTPPTITLLGPTPVLIPVSGTYTEHGATADDAEDGDLTSQIEIDASAVNTSLAGSYNVAYSVTDSDATTTTVNRRVRVISENGSSFANSYILNPGAQRLVANRTNNYFTLTVDAFQTFTFSASDFDWNFLDLTVYNSATDEITDVSITNNPDDDGKSVQFTTTYKGQYYIMVYDEYRNLNPANITVRLTEN